jgi:probable phosphoglycerate mutase
VGTTLYLVRHGETEDNVRQIMQGQTQGCLTEHGRQQAAEVRDQMRQLAVDAVVASDMRRSIQTATIIAEPHGLPVVSTPLLRERDWGSFTGRYIPDLKDEVWPDDIETLDCLLQRAQRFLEYIVTNYKGQTVVAVGHGIVNKAIQAVFFRKPMNQVQRMANAEVRMLCLSTSAEVTSTTTVASSTVASTSEVSASAVATTRTGAAEATTATGAAASDVAATAE